MSTRSFFVGVIATQNGCGARFREAQYAVLIGKPCTFLVYNRSFSAFCHYKNKERLLKGLDVKWHIPSTCLDASRMWFSSGFKA